MNTSANTNTDTRVRSLLEEVATYPPPRQLAARAGIARELRDAAETDRLRFWADQARTLEWATPFTRTLDWSNPPFATWFDDGALNVSVNCLDRHVAAGIGDRVAIYWEGEDGTRRAITYAELHRDVQRAANALESLGVEPGEVVTIYLPMIPEAVVAMLACARIGAAHSVIFAGYSADAIRTRITDADSRIVITATGSNRKGRVLPMRRTVDEALARPGHRVEHVIVVDRSRTVRTGDGAAAAGAELPSPDGPGSPGKRHLDWDALLEAAPTLHEARAFPAEQPLFVLYTSGTTGAPKGILHTSGGYLTQAATTHRASFDLRPEEDVYWCTADIGWITGHSYVVYGPLANGATQVIYEGAHNYPTPSRWFEIIERYGVTIFYSAPTAIRGFMKEGRRIVQGHDLTSLRLLGSVGEPINPEAWEWYREVIGSDRTPIVDTWWQTETGAHMITPLPTVDDLKAGSAQHPFPGIEAEVVDDDGRRVDPGQMGLLTIKEPWPSMARGIWKNPERFVETYWSRFPGRYFAGDGAGVDRDGDLWLLGRVDDVMNVSGHRLSTTEIESALVDHPFVAESAVVGASDETTGQAVIAFVVVKDSQREAVAAVDAVEVLRAHVASVIGGFARPRQLYLVDEVPKTRSGKIMRRLLRDVAEGRRFGDTSTLTDATVMRAIADGIEAGVPA